MLSNSRKFRKQKVLLRPHRSTQTHTHYMYSYIFSSCIFQYDFRFNFSLLFFPFRILQFHLFVLFHFCFLSVPFGLLWTTVLMLFVFLSPSIFLRIFIESISLMWKMLKMPSIHASTNVKRSIEPKLFQR